MLLGNLLKREATGEGGLITGVDPTSFTSSDPLRLWIIQVVLIIVMSQILSLCFSKLRQPRVIAEVFGGILLGPTAFGRIPGFTNHLFPPASIPYLSLTADVGLCLFLFLVGLEIDTSIVVRNARMSCIVSLAGIALPFGFGSLLSIPLYHRFIDHTVPFTDFMLFTGVAYSITAFPILCRILSELKLLDTNVGIVVLSAGIGNDIIGWVLLALSVALVNASSALSALWILLVCIAFAIFLLFPVKYAMLWLARVTRSTENGPTTFYMTISIILVWVCAFFTDSIGIHAIFGSFISGLVIPREGGLAITLTEKLEDMVTIVFLPLFFALSGLYTNLGLLNDGITWAFCIAIILLSFGGKFGGCTIASKLAGYGWREACTIGGLMSCKGLIELIVLNIGLQAGILSQRVFSMFVLEALVLTFITKPLVTAIYKPEHRVRVNETTTPTNDEEQGKHNDKASTIDEEQPWRHRFTVVIDKLDHIPGAMTLTQLLLPPQNTASDVMSTATRIGAMERHKMPDVSIDALQLVEYSDRTSAIMKSSATDSLIHTGPVLGIFRTFGELNDLAVTTSLSVVRYEDFAHSVAEHAQKHGSHLVLLPWAPPNAAPAPVADATEAVTTGDSTVPHTPKVDHNPFDALFNASGRRTDRTSSDMQSQFVRGVFSQSKIDVALFIDTGDRLGARTGTPMHVFLPFFGGPDDRLALAFVVQLCLNPRMSATVIRMVKRDGAGNTGEELIRPPRLHTEGRSEALAGDGITLTSVIESPDTIYGHATTEVYLRSATADNIAWAKYATPSDDDTVLRQAVAHIRFSEAHTTTPLQAAIRQVRAIRDTSPRLLVVTGRSRRLAKESHHAEMKQLMETYRHKVGLEGMRRTMGDVGMAMFMGGSASAVVVMQAAEPTVG